MKSSAKIGEWLHFNKFEPKKLFNSNPSLHIYRKFRQQQKPIELFNQCGSIYLTSIAFQRPLLLKLITMLGGNVDIQQLALDILIYCFVVIYRSQLIAIAQKLLLENHQKHCRY